MRWIKCDCNRAPLVRWTCAEVDDVATQNDAMPMMTNNFATVPARRTGSDDVYLRHPAAPSARKTNYSKPYNWSPSAGRSQTDGWPSGELVSMQCPSPRLVIACHR